MKKALVKTDFNFPRQKSVYHGKVRDVYNINDEVLVMVATDRISAFDVILPEGIPYKGQMLNQIAEKALLPKAVISFIRTHHGRGKAKYFYNSFKNQYPDKPINDELFTYPGPNPFSKETAVLMMADSVEAASRSLKEHTEESISALVNKIIDGQIADGLLKSAPLTFKDVETIKSVFVDKLKTMFHTRISYPDLKKQ